MIKSVSEKAGIKKSARAIYVNAPKEAIKTIAAPDLELASAMRGEFDYSFIC